MQILYSLGDFIYVAKKSTPTLIPKEVSNHVLI